MDIESMITLYSLNPDSEAHLQACAEEIFGKNVPSAELVCLRDLSHRRACDLLREPKYDDDDHLDLIEAFQTIAIWCQAVLTRLVRLEQALSYPINATGGVA